MTWLPAEVAQLVRPDLVTAALLGAALALLLRRLLPLLAFGLLALLLMKPDIVHQFRAALAAGNFSSDLSDQTLVSFLVGLAAGFIIVLSLLHVRYLVPAMLVGAAIVVAYAVATDSVNPLVAHANGAIRHIVQDRAFVAGLVVGKLLAGVGNWHRCRDRGGLRL